MGISINSFWDVLLWSFWIFIWISAIFIWFRCIFHLFNDPSMSGWGKAGWAALLIFVPWLGALIYLIARGKSVGEWQMAAVADAQAQQEEYIKSVAASGATPAEQITHAKSLLDSGEITEAEFAALRSKARSVPVGGPIQGGRQMAGTDAWEEYIKAVTASSATPEGRVSSTNRARLDSGSLAILLDADDRLVALEQVEHQRRRRWEVIATVTLVGVALAGVLVAFRAEVPAAAITLSAAFMGAIATRAARLLLGFGTLLQGGRRDANEQVLSSATEDSLLVVTRLDEQRDEWRGALSIALTSPEGFVKEHR